MNIDDCGLFTNTAENFSLQADKTRHYGLFKKTILISARTHYFWYH